MGRVVCKPFVAQKPSVRRKDPAYLAKVRRLPCCICEAFGELQTSETQAHHPIHNRFGTRKTMDRFSIPLCRFHHTGGNSEQLAIHEGKETWREKYGNDFDFTLPTQDKVRAME